ncbi:hypothetical protein RvY_03505 [Ramazzottius varieornatus]|uniref:14-3-3 domain-containing protein n=1 Tax=Ramazzottius varieornatus TaxID=947166 RepID=A0A1D1URP4_RAMVA|nr:hypothetical protein RvY_03505 [Ramazzottius varieornatus]
MGESPREMCVFAAKLSEQAERYDEMAAAVKDMVRAAGAADLSPEERSLLSVAYKNVTGSRRAAWRILSTLEARATQPQHRQHNGHSGKDEDVDMKLAQASKLRQEVEKELRTLCDDIVSLLDKTLIPQATLGESKVFYYKMKGDYFRYLAELTSADKKDISETAQTAKKGVAESAQVAYRTAMDIANSELAPTHPIRLGLALNFSVFYYEIMQSPDRAIRLSKSAFDDAIAELDNLTEESYKDSTMILQLLRDNLTLWSADGVAEDKDANDMDN